MERFDSSGWRFDSRRQWLASPYGSIAQLEERLTVNQVVAGSSLAAPASLWLRLRADPPGAPTLGGFYLPVIYFLIVPAS